MKGPRVLVVLNTDAAWSRGILQGFMATAHERGWELLHYHPNADLGWLAEEWTPAAALFGPELPAAKLARLESCPIVSVNADRSAQGIASVTLDEQRIGLLAFQHLRARGFRHVSSFRFESSPFAVARERAFFANAATAQLAVAPGWWRDGVVPPRSLEDPVGLLAWLRALPRPCGVFTCTDSWGRVVARYARAAGLRVPEDIALVGVDNDVVECELISPPLSSVAIPWRSLGEQAAALVQLALTGSDISRQQIVISPVDVVTRRSSDALAVDDPLTAQAVTWIRAHADVRLTVPMVARAVDCSRQRLERRFRAALGRTVQEEVRRAHVEAAKLILGSTHAALSEVAQRSGFTNAALLSTAFQRELGMPPGAYRREMQGG
jgi:LacI family transcriptional regulator